MTAELCARQIREELDALRVIGVDPLREMVAPRLLALVVAQVVLLMVSLVAGAVAVYVSVTVVFHAAGGPFAEQFIANTGVLDVYGALGKSIVFGLLIGAICCYKGLNVSGGAEGVGRAVNEAVVSSLLWIFFVSALYTMVFLSLFPDASVFR
jgi:phospholipid/cholesterol/gamma-HCH transport system permease protein